MSARVRFQVFVVALVTLVGCYARHEGEGRPPDGSIDGGGDASTDAGRDTGGSIDSGVSDSGDGGTLRCEAHEIDLACGVDGVAAGRPQLIRVKVGGPEECYCGEEIECIARRGDEPNVLELSTGLCTDGPLCDACFPYVESTCDLPDLEEGAWTVRVNGDPAFDLQVLPPGVLPEWGLTCVSPAVVDSSCGVEWPPFTGGHSVICHDQGAYPDTHVAIDVTQTCGGCADSAGPCQVEVFDDIIRVRPTNVTSGCDVDCPDICTRRVDRCVTPALPEGRYRVLVEGIDDFESSIEVSPSPPTGGVCGPVERG